MPAGARRLQISKPLPVDNRLPVVRLFKRCHPHCGQSGRLHRVYRQRLLGARACPTAQHTTRREKFRLSGFTENLGRRSPSLNQPIVISQRLGRLVTRQIVLTQQQRIVGVCRTRLCAHRDPINERQHILRLRLLDPPKLLSNLNILPAAQHPVHQPSRNRDHRDGSKLPSTGIRRTLALLRGCLSSLVFKQPQRGFITKFSCLCLARELALTKPQPVLVGLWGAASMPDSG